MDFQSSPLVAQTIPQPAQAASPPVIEADGRAVADTAAIKQDATPNVPLPIPSNASQTGLVSAAVLSKSDSAPKLDSAGVSAAERTLKPYGISMLPDRGDEAKDAVPEAEASAEKVEQ